ncbi:hypothetical protein MLD52_10370 [Puniceicoccaceae bacterium K14]|nr:hypothetical protein [Puniceicoccaceae bacterium K14]
MEASRSDCISPLEDKINRSSKRTTLLVALVIQVVLLLGTLFVIVLDPVEVDTPHFVSTGGVVKEERSPVSQEIQSRFMRRMSNPTMLNRIQVDTPASFNLPAMPELPTDSFSLDQSDVFLAENAQTLLQESGLLAAASAIGSASSGASFFGIEDSGQRIVIVVNTSASVVNKARRKGVTISEIQDEVVGLIEGLTGRVSFGVVQFSQGARAFAEELAPAISGNKEAAREWVSQMKGSPPVLDESTAGHEGALWLAMSLEPDLIFLVTDGVLNKRVRTGDGYQYPQISYDVLLSGMHREVRECGLKTRVNVVGFELSDKSRNGLKRLVRDFGGSLREF